MAYEITQVCPKYVNILCMCGLPSAMFKLQGVQNPEWMLQSSEKSRTTFLDWKIGEVQARPRTLVLQFISPKENHAATHFSSPHLHSLYCYRFLLLLANKVLNILRQDESACAGLLVSWACATCPLPSATLLSMTTAVALLLLAISHPIPVPGLAAADPKHQHLPR